MDAGIAERAAEVTHNVAPQAIEQAQRVAQQEPSFTFLWWLPILLAFILVFSVEFARALPFKKETLSKKPFTCDACMTGWAGIGIFLLQLWAFGTGTWVLALMHTWPALGICLLLLSLKSYWKPTIPTGE